jgi:hypothetical protein
LGRAERAPHGSSLLNHGEILTPLATSAASA